MRLGVDMTKKVALLIPSMGNVHCFIRMMDSLVNETFYKDLDVFITFNPKEEAEAVASASHCISYSETVARNIGTIRNMPIGINTYLVPRPIGYGGAINHSYRKMVEYENENNINYDYVIFGNDDLIFTPRWLQILVGAAEDDVNNYTSSSGMGNVKRKIEKKYKYGLIGPLSDNVAGEQRIFLGDDTYGNVVHKASNSQKMNRVASFISGFCMMAKRELIEDLKDTLEHPDDGPIDERNFPIGGYEDNDICRRAMLKGWKCKIAHNCFIGHIGHQSLPSEQKNGLANRLNYYLKWEKDTKSDDKKCVAAYRTCIKTVNELAQLISSMINTAPIVDGIGMLLTNNPSEALESYDANMFQQLPPMAQAFLNGCKGADLSVCASMLEKFILAILPKEGKVPVSVKHWDGDFNERDERNETHVIAESMGADYIMSVDTDEFPENRITRTLFRRLLRHPDPSVTHLATGWLNHWETHELLRIDPPFNRMSGARIWKVFPDPLRIEGGTDIGLHCGNCPEYSHLGLRPAAFRFRHLSHVRGVDRWAKMKFYNEIDKEKRLELIGNSDYSHISKQENVRVSIYNPKNGIGAFMLAYEEEDPDGIAGWFDHLYPVSDKLVIVWTGEWNDEDKGWAADYEQTNIPEDKWNNKTGPSWKLAQYLRLFEADIIHSPLEKEKGLAGCRNAGIDYLCENSNNHNISWAVFFDPDEQVSNHPLFFSSLTYYATRNDTHGYLFQFKNLIKGKGEDYSWAPSESIRMFRLDPTGQWRMSGRVHETFEHAANKLKAAGHTPSVSMVKEDYMVINNYGLLNDPEQMAKKLQKYQSLLIDELKENPFKSSAWTSLGMQYLNDGEQEFAKTCLERACMTAGPAYLPFKERALVSLREGLAYLVEARKRLSNSWEWTEVCDKMINVLKQIAPPPPIIETSTNLSEGEEPPYFPYDKIGITDEGNFYIKIDGDSDEGKNKSHKKHD